MLPVGFVLVATLAIGNVGISIATENARGRGHCVAWDWRRSYSTSPL